MFVLDVSASMTRPRLGAPSFLEAALQAASLNIQSKVPLSVAVLLSDLTLPLLFLFLSRRFSCWLTRRRRTRWALCCWAPQVGHTRLAGSPLLTRLPADTDNALAGGDPAYNHISVMSPIAPVRNNGGKKSKRLNKSEISAPNEVFF